MSERAGETRSPLQEVHAFVRAQLTEINLRRHNERLGPVVPRSPRRQPQGLRPPLAPGAAKPVLDPLVYQRFRATQRFCVVFDHLAGRMAVQRAAELFSRWRAAQGRGAGSGDGAATSPLYW